MRVPARMVGWSVGNRIGDCRWHGVPLNLHVGRGRFVRDGVFGVAGLEDSGLRRVFGDPYVPAVESHTAIDNPSKVDVRLKPPDARRSADAVRCDPRWI